MVLVVWRVLGFLDDEIHERWAIHRAEIHLSRSGEHGIANRFGREATPVLAPQGRVRRVDGRVCFVVCAGLPVDGAVEDKAVQVLDRAAAVAEFDREPVEQLGVRWLFADAAEVI